MPEWREFSYGEFYDVPRHILVPLAAGILYLACFFDDSLDEYGEYYEMYLLPSNLEVKKEWPHLREHALRKVGTVPVAQVAFDETKRHKIDLSTLGEIGHLLNS